MVALSVHRVGEFSVPIILTVCEHQLTSGFAYFFAIRCQVVGNVN